MKYISCGLLLIFLTGNLLFGQDFSCANLINELYPDTQIKKPNTTDNPDVHYAKVHTYIPDVEYADETLGGNPCSSQTACLDGNAGLVYEVYYPLISYSNNNKLPAVILFHGGGYTDCSDFHQADGMDFYCTEFAKRGFIAFNVEYRRGRIKDDKAKYTSASQLLAVYRACQDARGALRTIVARELSGVTPYRIDLQNVFLGGVSAGADIALNTGFDNRKMIDEVFPQMASYLNSIDVDNYGGNAAASDYTIKGVLCMWGGMNIPINYASSHSDFFSQNKTIPALISFQGGADDLVKPDTTNIYFSEPPSDFNHESFCLNKGTYSLPGNGANNPDLIVLGAEGMFDALKSHHVPCEIYIDCDMGHGLNEETSDFGLGDASVITDSQVQLYIVQRAATFFQYVMNNNFPYKLTHKKFIDCENERFGCNSDADTKCQNNSACPDTLISSISPLLNAPTEKSSVISGITSLKK